MKLYKCEFGYCGIATLQVLTGLKFKTLIRLVMEARRTSPRDYNGYRCSSKKMLYNVRDGIFFSEVIEVINQRKICKDRVVGNYNLRFKKNVVQFAKKFKVGTYLVLISSHFIVVRDGKTYDNQAWGCLPCQHPFFYDTVIAYAILDRNKTPQEIIENDH
jgi:hypothetical protein